MTQKIQKYSGLNTKSYTPLQSLGNTLKTILKGIVWLEKLLSSKIQKLEN